MSTVAYAQLTNSRHAAATTGTPSPGIGRYADALAALVPAEILAVHALIMSYTTTITPENRQPLSMAFWFLIGLSAVAYAIPRYFSGRPGSRLDWWDCLRILIPPAAFMGWTMLQRPTAFDAAFPMFDLTWRTVIPLIGAVFLGLVAGGLGYKPDQKPPST